MRCPQLSWLCVAMAGCVVLAAVPDAARAQAKINPKPKAQPEVKNLSFHGVHAVDVFDLEHSIETQASSCTSVLLSPICWISHAPLWVTRKYLDHDELARDIIRIRVFYWLHGYRSAVVDTVVTPNGPHAVNVAFNVTEGAPTLVRRLVVDFDSTLFTQKRIKKLQLLKAGQPLDMVKLDSMRVLYADEMWSKGHSDATVDTTVTVDASGLVADVRLALIPNHPTYVGEITIVGLDKVSRATVMNSITLRTGDLYRQSDVLESQRNLFESNLFRLAAVDVPPQFDSVKHVTITVAESPLHDASVATGLTNIDFLQTEGRYSAFNVFGGARRLDVAATAGNLFANQLAGRGFFYDPGVDIAGARATKYLLPTWSASVDFSQPAFLHRPANQAGFGVFAHRRSTPGIFIDRGYGGTATFTNQVAIKAPASLTYRFEVNRVDAGDVYFCVNYGVCDTLAINGLRSHQRLSPLLLTGFIDRSDDPLDPTRGYQARVDFEYASGATLSDYTYQRAFVDVAGYNHRGLTSVYAAHLRVGWVRGSGGDIIHPRKLFYAGGATSVRGYGTNQLGPRILTISPERLTDSTKTGHCTTTNIADGTCDANSVVGLKDSEFNPQPLGGTSLLEGSVEYRFPIAFRRKLWLAGFIDGGIVGAGALPSLRDIVDITRGVSAITPGIGFRYTSPVGPIRVDVGYNPSRTEMLPIATETIVNGERKIILLKTPRSYTPARTLLDRMTLHLSIGQAY
jgi:outer membrane protein assembly factor BamA